MCSHYPNEILAPARYRSRKKYCCPQMRKNNGDNNLFRSLVSFFYALKDFFFFCIVFNRSNNRKVAKNYQPYTTKISKMIQIDNFYCHKVGTAITIWGLIEKRKISNLVGPILFWSSLMLQLATIHISNVNKCK